MRLITSWINAAAHAAATAPDSGTASLMQPEVLVAAASLVVSVISLLVAHQARVDTRVGNRTEMTRAYPSEFRTLTHREKRRWVEKKLSAHVARHRLSAQCGLSALDVGAPVKIRVDAGGEVEMMPSDVARDVLTFFDNIARDIRKGRLDNETILDEMSAPIAAAWRSLVPHLKSRGFAEYYRFYRRKFSIGSLASIIEDNSTTRQRLAAIRKRWGRR